MRLGFPEMLFKGSDYFDELARSQQQCHNRVKPSAVLQEGIPGKRSDGQVSR